MVLQGKNYASPSIKNYQATKETLHGIAKAVAIIPRALADPHPLWWHASLNILDSGLATDVIVLDVVNQP